MELNHYIKPGVSSLMKFDNFFNCQPEIQLLKNEFLFSDFNCSGVLIHGESGNGISHLMNAVCNEFIRNEKNVILISTRWIKKFLKENKKQSVINDFQDLLLSSDLIAIDNLEEIQYKSRRLIEFISLIIEGSFLKSKKLLMGSSSEHIFRCKIFPIMNEFKKIKLKKMDAQSSLSMLHYLSEFDFKISEKIIRHIAKYNGTSQEYINCLISWRYRDNSYHENDQLIQNDFDDSELRKYFNGPQFRKCFIKDDNDFFTVKDFLKKGVIKNN